LKICCVLQDHYDDERDKTVFHNTTSDLQDQDHSVQDQDRFCGLRPVLTSQTTSLVIVGLSRIVFEINGDICKIFQPSCI